jgi:hypothetical protein
MNMESLTETPTPEKKSAKRKVKRRVRKARTAAEPKPVKADGIFTGLTVADCCDGCDVEACVISGQPYCAHPRKGGLQSPQMSDVPAMKRLQQAKRILGKQALDLRDT